MKKGILLMMLIIATFSSKAQQDAQLTQYLFNGIYINPAYSGYKADVFAQSYFRSQWVGVKGAPVSYAVAADGSFSDDHVGLGLILASDKIGAQSSFTGYVNYAYRIQIGDDESSRLSFGIAGGYVQLGLDGTQLNAIQQNDQAVPFNYQSTIVPDVNFGIFYGNNNYFFGLSATNLLAKYAGKNRESTTIAPIPQPHFYLTGGALIPLNDYGGMMLKPVVLIKDDTRGPTTIDLDGIMILNERISIGAFYRSSFKLYSKPQLQDNLPHQGAFGALAEFFATPNVRIGYSYDKPVNALGSYTSGSHELSLGFYFGRAGSGTGSEDYRRRCYKF